MAKSKETKPTAAERGQLTAKLAAMGISGPVLAGIIRANRTLGQISDDLAAVLKGSPRK